MVKNLMWIVTGLSILGTILNIKKLRICFVIWLITNSLWSIYDFSIKDYPQAILFIVYVALAIYGIVEWRKSSG